MDKFPELNASNLKAIARQAREGCDGIGTHITEFYEKYGHLLEKAARQGKGRVSLTDIPIIHRQIVQDLVERGFTVDVGTTKHNVTYMVIGWGY